MKARLFSAIVTAVSLLFVVMCIMAIPMSEVAPKLFAKQRAHALAPVLYPGANQISISTTVETGRITESHIFEVQAPVGYVRRWMDRAAFGFDGCSLNETVCFVYKRCDQTPLGRVLSFLAYLGYEETEQPCVSVLLERSTAGSHQSLYQTYIHVTYSWPTN